MPKVSVIIPAYNAGKYIAETMDSVLVQTYSDFEIIVVDDGSKDQTVSIVKQFKIKYPEKVKLIQKENGGPASARNAGIKVAVGEYIAFIDADDLWLPQKLEKQVRYFETQPSQVGIVYTDARSFDKDGIWINKYYPKFNGKIYKELLNSMLPNLSVMVRKECFQNVGYFEEALDIIEDHDMWLRISMKYEVLCLDEMLSLYRQHSQGRSKEIEKTWSRSLRVMEKHLKMVAGNIELEKAVKNVFSERLYNFGHSYLREGHLLAARQMYERSLAMRASLKTYLMKTTTFIPFRILNISNKLIKLVFKPTKIVKLKYELEKILTELRLAKSVKTQRIT